MHVVLHAGCMSRPRSDHLDFVSLPFANEICVQDCRVCDDASSCLQQAVAIEVALPWFIPRSSPEVLVQVHLARIQNYASCHRYQTF